MLKFFFKNKKNIKDEQKIESEICLKEKNINHDQFLIKEIKAEEVKIELSWFGKLKLKLKQSNFLFNKIFNLFAASEIDYNQLEELLLNIDIDYELTEKLINQIKLHDKKERLTSESAKKLIKQFVQNV